MKKRCKKSDYKGIHDRFLRDHVFRERMIEHHRDEELCRRWDALADEDHTHHLTVRNDRDEEVCSAWDVLAEEDHTFRMSQAEYFYYRQNWWISLNKSGNDTQPLRKRSDFKQALSTLNRLHQEAGGQQLRPMPYWKYKQWKPASSSSSTWWQWRESWWSS